MKYSREGRRPVGDYTEKQLHTFLVEDAVKRHATQLDWAIAAYARIGKLNRRGPEAAYQAVLDDVEAITGSRSMPVASTNRTELGRLLQ